MAGENSVQPTEVDAEGTRRRQRLLQVGALMISWLQRCKEALVRLLADNGCSGDQVGASPCTAACLWKSWFVKSLHVTLLQESTDWMIDNFPGARQLVL